MRAEVGFFCWAWAIVGRKKEKIAMRGSARRMGLRYWTKQEGDKLAGNILLLLIILLLIRFRVAGWGEVEDCG